MEHNTNRKSNNQQENQNSEEMSFDGSTEVGMAEDSTSSSSQGDASFDEQQ